MKALTLTQPWATLVALGEKRIETRGWSTKYRGEIAIHAAKNFPLEAREICREKPFLPVLTKAGLDLYDQFPLGKVIAVAVLVNVQKIQHAPEKHIGYQWEGLGGTKYEFPLTPQERAFGNHTPGRYAWMFDRVTVVLPSPVPARGALSLWNWPLPVCLVCTWRGKIELNNGICPQCEHDWKADGL